MSYRAQAPQRASGLGYTPVTTPYATTMPVDPVEDIPTVHLGLTYDPEPEPPAVNVAGIPLWIGLVIATYWLANRVGGRI